MEEWPKGQSNSLDCCNNRNSQFIYQRHYHILVKSSYKKPPFLIKAFIPLQNKNQIYLFDLPENHLRECRELRMNLPEHKMKFSGST